jgi:hypothetical protein
VARLEYERDWRGTAAEALRAWSFLVRDPYHRLHDPKYPGCGYWACCPDPAARDALEVIVHALLRRDARRFRKLLAALDDLW